MVKLFIMILLWTHILLQRQTMNLLAHLKWIYTLFFFSNLHAVPFLKFFYLVFSLCFLYRSYPVFKYSLTSTVITWRVIFLLLLVSKGNKFIRTFKIFVVLFFFNCLSVLSDEIFSHNESVYSGVGVDGKGNSKFDPVIRKVSEPSCVSCPKLDTS